MFDKILLWLFVLCLVPGLAECKKKEKRAIVRMETDCGTIRVALFEETPIHRENFLTLVEKGYYDGTLFHRTISDYMIQGGDPDSRSSLPGDLLGEGGPGYTLPPEFCLPYLYHWRGALAAAREPDDVNPEMRSSGSQFYIVWGKKQGAGSIKKVRAMLEEKGVELTPQMVDDYTMRGGCPHLDGTFTVFGEVIEGLDVVKEIQLEPTDSNDRPLKDIVIRQMTIEQRGK